MTEAVQNRKVPSSGVIWRWLFRRGISSSSGGSDRRRALFFLSPRPSRESCTTQAENKKRKEKKRKNNDKNKTKQTNKQTKKQSWSSFFFQIFFGLFFLLLVINRLSPQMLCIRDMDSQGISTAGSSDYFNKLKTVFEVCDEKNDGYITIEHFENLIREHFGGGESEVNKSLIISFFTAKSLALWPISMFGSWTNQKKKKNLFFSLSLFIFYFAFKNCFLKLVKILNYSRCKYNSIIEKKNKQKTKQNKTGVIDLGTRCIFKIIFISIFLKIQLFWCSFKKFLGFFSPS